MPALGKLLMETSGLLVMTLFARLAGGSSRYRPMGCEPGVRRRYTIFRLFSPPLHGVQ